MKKPMPTPPISISAATIASHESADTDSRRPVKHVGQHAAGIMILEKNVPLGSELHHALQRCR